MTAEVAVLNRFGVALSADSANTIDGGRRVSATANKVFSLCSRRPLAVMVYHNAAVMGVPWETMIKYCRERLSTEDIPDIETCASKFINIIGSHKDICSPHGQVRLRSSLIAELNADITDGLGVEFAEAMVSDGTASAGDLATKLLSERIKIWKELLLNAELSNITKEDAEAFLALEPNLLQSSLKEYLGRVFPHVTFDFQVVWPLYFNLAIDRIRKFMPWTLGENGSGAVIAGFGEERFFPELQELWIGGVINNKLKFLVKREVAISEENPAEIVAFAQAAQNVQTFLTGIDQEYQIEIDTLISSILQQITNYLVDYSGKPLEDPEEISKAKQSALKALHEHRKLHHQWPILGAVSTLSLTELAATAESLVALAALRQRLSDDQETVQAPFDTAVISKYDGMVWTNRKHYFPSVLNPRFMSRYNGSKPSSNIQITNGISDETD